MNKIPYIYFRDNNWYKLENVIKVGITSAIVERGNIYLTGEIIKGNFIKVIKLDIDLDYLNIIDKKIKNKFIDLNVYNGGGTEFYQRNIIDKIEDYLLELDISFELLNENDLKRLNRIREKDNDIKLRDYQIKIIDEGYQFLKSNNKLYLELATGAGKSIISYKLINMIRPSNIIIFTPRIDICEQNKKDDYLKHLTYKYDNFICSCIQSIDKIYELIKSKNLNDIFIWFDEAHYGLNKWIDEYNDIKIFFLKDTNQIKYRLFTSASPNKDVIYRNRDIYGELYSPIKISKLMKNDWLSKIKVHIYKEDYKLNHSNSNNLIKFLLNFFVNSPSNINIGMCFNNNCDIALKRFNIHLDLYLNDETKIKPYLLLNDDYLNKLDIDKSFTDIHRYDKERSNAISYIVDKYSMGYDNKFIDLLIFPDPKYSNEDIIQKIGRGLRPDGKGIDGRNLNKINNILLPTYINQDEDIEENKKNKFERIEKILIYLIIDLELDIKNNLINVKNDDECHKLKVQGYLDEDIYKEVDKDDKEDDSDIYTIIYDIYKRYRWTIPRITNKLANNKIYNYKDYLKFIKENPYLNLPKELFRCFPEFNFYHTYKFDKCPYYSKEEIKEIIKKYKEDLLEFEDDDEDIITYLNKKDDKIPNMCLWFFYGGIKEDYFS